MQNMGKVENNNNELADHVENRSHRKIKARREKRKGLWYGLGMFGLVGWSVSIPTLFFLALGIWIDTRFSSPYSWTLMMLVLGIAIGCLNAWFWVKKESNHE